MKKHYTSRWLFTVCLLSIPVPGSAQTAEEVMQKVIANLQGPPGTAVVAEGTMRFSRRNLQVRAARYCHDGTEGFQLDVLSPVEDQEVAGAIPQTNKKYRVIRTGGEISTLTYLPSLRRGRKVNYVPLDGILGSDYPYYLLPLASDLLHDFTYAFVHTDPDTPTVKGLAKEGARSPYTQVELALRRRGGTYTIEQAAYAAPYDRGFTLVLRDFTEFVPGYWAPGVAAVKETTFTFEHWATLEPPAWLHSTNHSQFDAQGVPQLDVR